MTKRTTETECRRAYSSVSNEALSANGMITATHHPKAKRLAVSQSTPQAMESPAATISTSLASTPRPNFATYIESLKKLNSMKTEIVDIERKAEASVEKKNERLSALTAEIDVLMKNRHSSEDQTLKSKKTVELQVFEQKLKRKYDAEERTLHKKQKSESEAAKHSYAEEKAGFQLEEQDLNNQLESKQQHIRLLEANIEQERAAVPQQFVWSAFEEKIVSDVSIKRQNER